MRKPFLKKKNFLPSSLLSSGAAAQVNKNGLLCIAQEPFFPVAWATFICVKSFTSVYITDRKAYNVIAKV